MTDEKSARAFIDGEGGRIGVKCDEPGSNSLYVHVISSRYLGGGGLQGGYRTGMVRFDGDAAEENSWYFDESSSILTEGAHVWPFIDRLKRSKTLAWRGSIYDNHQFTISFDVPQNFEGIDKVVAACEAVRL